MAEDGLRGLTSSWHKLLQRSREEKKRDFQDDADEAMSFFNGPYDWLYTGWKAGSTKGFVYSMGEDELPGPSARMTVNKVAELVQLFGPALYHRNPVRKVIPRKFPEVGPGAYAAAYGPQAQQAFEADGQAADQARAIDAARAVLLEAYLNFTPVPLDLKTHARGAIDEALIKGRGCLWTETYQPTGSPSRLAGSFASSVDDLLIDPDVECLRDAKWVARRCVRPFWEVERKYGLAQDTLKQRGTLESFTQQSGVATSADGDYRRKQGLTNDLLVYWEIYSRMGAGGLLSGVRDDLREKLAPLGDYVYLVICEHCPYPLNLPPPVCDYLTSDDPAEAQAALPEAQQKTQWPVPFWADDAWPVTVIDFAPVPRKVWPMPLIKPGIGELKFLNWAWSFLAGKVRTACRDFFAIAKSAGEELKERIKHGPDYTIIEVEAIHQDIDKVVRFLQHPAFNPEIYKVIEGVTNNFERRTGLTELMYGMSSRQLRSAQEANIKSDAVNVRPDEMASRVEDAMTEASRKEAFCARWSLRGPDVQNVLGESGARWWEMLLVPTDPALVLQLEYRVEANSARKPNKAMDRDNMQQAMQQLFTPLWQYGQATGQIGPVNALVRDWAKSIDLDPQPYMVQPPPPPPAPPPGPSGPPPPARGGPPP